MDPERLTALLKAGAPNLSGESDEQSHTETTLIDRLRGERQRLQIQAIIDATAEAFNLHPVTEGPPL